MYSHAEDIMPGPSGSFHPQGTSWGPPDLTFRHFILLDILKQKKTSEVFPASG